jgi:hypothetical protein
VPDPAGASRALAGGQGPVLLRNAPAGARAALDQSLHAASVDAVHWTFLVSGVAGVLAGLAVLVLVRSRPDEDAPEPGGAPAARSALADPVERA